MAKRKMSDEEFERQYKNAVRRGEEAIRCEPQARSARYDHDSDRLIIEMKNGATFIIPCNLIQGLRGADPEMIAEVKLLPRGAALHWESLDVDFSVAGLLMGLFGTQTWMSEMGRRGGSVSSEAKAAAVRENGRKGGRPRTRKRA